MAARPARDWVDVERRGRWLFAIAPDGSAHGVRWLRRTDLQRVAALVGVSGLGRNPSNDDLLTAIHHKCLDLVEGGLTACCRPHSGMTYVAGTITDGLPRHRPISTTTTTTQEPDPAMIPQNAIPAPMLPHTGPDPEPVAQVEPTVTPAPVVEPVAQVEPVAPPPVAAPPGSLDAIVAAIVDARIAQHPAPVDATQVAALVDTALADALAALPTPEPVYRGVTVTVAPGLEPRTTTLEGYVNPAFPKILGMVAEGLNVAMVGPTGTGKTHIATQVADALGLPFYSISCGPDMGKHELLGFRNAAGEAVTTDLETVYRTGGLFLFDEMDAASGAVLTGGNQALANRIVAFASGMQERHPNSRFVAAMNTFGLGPDSMYVGRQALDRASLNRWWIVEVDYDRKLERALAAAWLDGGRLDAWLAAIAQVRDNIERHRIQTACSTRQVSEGARLLARGILPTFGDVLAASVTFGLSRTDAARCLDGVPLDA